MHGRVTLIWGLVVHILSMPPLKLKLGGASDVVPVVPIQNKIVHEFGGFRLVCGRRTPEQQQS